MPALSAQERPRVLVVLRKRVVVRVVGMRVMWVAVGLHCPGDVSQGRGLPHGSVVGFAEPAGGARVAGGVLPAHRARMPVRSPGELAPCRRVRIR